MSITRLILVILGAIILVAGVTKLLVASFTIVGLALPLLFIVIGFLLLSGRGISL